MASPWPGLRISGHEVHTNAARKCCPHSVSAISVGGWANGRNDLAKLLGILAKLPAMKMKLHCFAIAIV